MSYQGGTHIYTSFKYFFNAFYFKIQFILKGELRGEHSAQLVCHGLALFLIHFISKFMSYQGGTHLYTSFKYFFNAFYFKIQVILKGELRGGHSAQLVCRILKVPPCPASMSWTSSFFNSFYFKIHVILGGNTRPSYFFLLRSISKLMSHQGGTLSPAIMSDIDLANYLSQRR